MQLSKGKVELHCSPCDWVGVHDPFLWVLLTLGWLLWEEKCVMELYL